MDRILIKDLIARCILGTDDDERHEKQNVVINLVLWTDLSRAGKSDDFHDAVDYRAVKKRVLAMAEESHFYLVEALAEAIAQLCLQDERVEKVEVRVEKPAALRFARSVGVEITRTRK